MTVGISSKDGLFFPFGILETKQKSCGMVVTENI